MVSQSGMLPNMVGTRDKVAVRRVRSWLTPRNFILALAAILVAYLALSPLVFLIQRMLTDANGVFTWANITDAYTNGDLPGLLLRSLEFTAGTTVVAMVLGTSLAWLHARTDIRFKSLLFAASVVPLIIPGLLYTVAWVTLASPRSGLLNMSAEKLFSGQPLNIFGIWGMIWVEATGLAPLVFLLMVAAFRAMDPSLEEAALTSGASGWRVTFRITFPLVKRAFLAAILIMAVRTLESFEAPALLGMPGRVWVFTTQIWSDMTAFPSNIGGASADASILLVIAIVGVAFHNWYGNRGGGAAATIRGKAFRARPRPLRGPGRWVANIFVIAYFVIVIVLPVGSLVYASFLGTTVPPSISAIKSMTLSNYSAVLSNVDVRQGALNSFILAIASATAVMLLMSIVAWTVVKTKARGRGILEGLTVIPMTFPGIVLGLALLFVYLRVSLPIYGTLGILFVAYMTKYVPYGMRYATASLFQIHDELEESAYVSGATWWQTFRRVVLPLLGPGLLAGWIYVAIVSIRELSSSLLISSPGTQPLAVAIWSMYNNGSLNQVCALGVLMILALTILVSIAYGVGSRVGIRQDAADGA